MVRRPAGSDEVVKDAIPSVVVPEPMLCRHRSEDKKPVKQKRVGLPTHPLTHRFTATLEHVYLSSRSDGPCRGGGCPGCNLFEITYRWALLLERGSAVFVQTPRRFAEAPWHVAV